MSASSTDQNPRYWGEYSNLQKVKHDLIREYLNGWFPKLGNWAGRILYFDTHAGRGRYAGGEHGSPLVALNTFLDHSWRERILEKSEVKFFFIERDEEYLEHLQAEIAAVGNLPGCVVVHSQAGECFKLLQDLVESIKSSKSRLAPAFVFVDPYGFKVPGATFFFKQWGGTKKAQAGRRLDGRLWSEMPTPHVRAATLKRSSNPGLAFAASPAA